MQSEVIDLLDMADGAGGGLPPPAGAMGGGGAERGGAPRSPSPLPVLGASSSLHGAPSLTPPRGEVACCLRKLSVRCLRLRDAEGVPLGLPCGGAGSHFACAACLEKYVGERPGRTIVCEGCLQASGVQAPYSIGGLAALVDALASRLRVEQRPLLQPLPPGSLDYAFAAHLFFFFRRAVPSRQRDCAHRGRHQPPPVARVRFPPPTHRGAPAAADRSFMNSNLARAVGVHVRRAPLVNSSSPCACIHDRVI